MRLGRAFKTNNKPLCLYLGAGWWSKEKGCYTGLHEILPQKPKLNRSLAW